MSWGNEATKKAKGKKAEAKPKFVCEWKHGAMLVMKFEKHREISIGGYTQSIKDEHWPYYLGKK